MTYHQTPQNGRTPNEDDDVIDKFDNWVMKGVNKSVRGWNWLTGRTKADLANTLHAMATVPEIGGALMEQPLNTLLFQLFVSAWVTTYACKTNRDFKKQEKYFEGEVKHLGVEMKKEMYKTGGKCFLIAAVCGGSQITKVGYPYVGAGLFLGYTIRSAAYYVMCADNLPPRKSVISRAKDALLEKLNEVNMPQPAPVPVRVYRQSL